MRVWALKGINLASNSWVCRSLIPYFKVKMVMDYWCALWFWDVREAGALPNRLEYWQDIAGILDIDLEKAAAEIHHARKKDEFGRDDSVQLNIFGPVIVQLSLSNITETIAEPEEPTIDLDGKGISNEVFARYAAPRDFFDQNERITIVQALADKYRFFHHQLEFLDVFWERGGFDLIAGNPPWLKLQFEESAIISEKFPENNQC